jgi:CheY-like chemotaxis protein
MRRPIGGGREAALFAFGGQKEGRNTMDRTLKIALADDDSRLQTFFAHLMKMLGHQIAVQAGNGEELVAGCLQESPELIITDMQMPVMTGLDAIDRIWDRQWIPAILVSGVPESQLFAARPPALRPLYLAKPVQLRDLTAAIERATLPLHRQTSPSGMKQPRFTTVRHAAGSSQRHLDGAGSTDPAAYRAAINSSAGPISAEPS